MPVVQGLAAQPLAVDANVILRFLTDEPPHLAARAAALFDAVEQGTCAVLLEDVVVAEVVWTLASFYRMPKQEIAGILLKLLAAGGVKHDDKEALQVALVLFHEKNLDFADALLAARALRSGRAALYSFDRDFDRVPGLTRYEPAAPASG
jgi:predicted nucleic acid-binding protein